MTMTKGAMMNKYLLELTKTLGNMFGVALNSDLSGDTIEKIQRQKQAILFDCLKLADTITTEINKNKG